jgi:hypothetical protein
VRVPLKKQTSGGNLRITSQKASPISLSLWTKSVGALQMKGWWESKINVLSRFMYSQKWNSRYFQNRIIMFCPPISTFMYLWAIYILYIWDMGLPEHQSWEYINHSQIHECGNWERGGFFSGNICF